MTRADVMTWSGRDVLDRDGRRVGRLDDVVYDTRTGDPEWAVVTSGLIRKRTSVVPISVFENAEDGALRVPFSEAEVDAAPEVDIHVSFTTAQAEELYAHYGLERGAARIETRRE